MDFLARFCQWVKWKLSSRNMVASPELQCVEKWKNSLYFEIWHTSLDHLFLAWESLCSSAYQTFLFVCLPVYLAVSLMAHVFFFFLPYSYYSASPFICLCLSASFTLFFFSGVSVFCSLSVYWFVRLFIDDQYTFQWTANAVDQSWKNKEREGGAAK